MCLRTFQSKPKVAEEDIACYKVLTEDLKSPCYGLQYELGKLITSDIQYDIKTLIEAIVSEGLHTYQHKDDAIKIATTNSPWKVLNGWTDAQWIHSPIVIECVIPKGSEYYAGEDRVGDKQYASNQLIPQEIISVKK